VRRVIVIGSCVSLPNSRPDFVQVSAPSSACASSGAALPLSLLQTWSKLWLYASVTDVLRPGRSIVPDPPSWRLT